MRERGREGVTLLATSGVGPSANNLLAKEAAVLKFFN